MYFTEMRQTMICWVEGMLAKKTIGYWKRNCDSNTRVRSEFIAFLFLRLLDSGVSVSRGQSRWYQPIHSQF